MLFEKYRKEIFRPECNPHFQTLHCIAHLQEDIGEALPHLNTVLGGFAYTNDPPSLTLKVYGKLITIHPREIAINALKDEIEADKILEWLKQEINDVWNKRGEIKPSYESEPRPGILKILKLLPRTNCGECKEPTCMVFAVRLAEGAKGLEGCPELKKENKDRLREYMAQFYFEGQHIL